MNRRSFFGFMAKCVVATQIALHTSIGELVPLSPFGNVVKVKWTMTDSHSQTWKIQFEEWTRQAFGMSPKIESEPVDFSGSMLRPGDSFEYLVELKKDNNE